MEFFDWGMLNTYAGAALAVAVLVEMTKGLPGVAKLPTQLWTYILALITLELAMTFDVGFTAQGAALATFNAAIVSLAANGGYEAVQRIKNSTTAKTDQQVQLEAMEALNAAVGKLMQGGVEVRQEVTIEDGADAAIGDT